jgi:hypothetical protein
VLDSGAAAIAGRQLADLGRRGNPGASSAISGGAASAGAGSPSSRRGDYRRQLADLGGRLSRS